MSRLLQVFLADVAQQDRPARRDPPRNGRTHAARAKQGDDFLLLVPIKDHVLFLLYRFYPLSFPNRIIKAGPKPRNGRYFKIRYLGNGFGKNVSYFSSFVWKNPSSPPQRSAVERRMTSSRGMVFPSATHWR